MTKALAFFGAFNPPTQAHLLLADHARTATGRESVIFVPSRSAYIRNDQGKDYAYQDDVRLEMLQAASKNRPWMQVTDWEMRQASQPRTYDTLCHLRSEGIHAALLLGSDKLLELETGWLHVKEIAGEFGIVCLPRSEDDPERWLREDPFLKEIAPWVQVIPSPMEMRHISSTKVRQLIREIEEREATLKQLVPPEIFEMLRKDSNT